MMCDDFPDNKEEKEDIGNFFVVSNALNRYKKVKNFLGIGFYSLPLQQKKTQMIALIIIGILLVGYVLIATECFTQVNKAAVAIFACTAGWVLYISYGADFVMSQHPVEYQNFLGGAASTSVSVKEFIAGNVFLKYVGRASEIVLFLLATMTIVEVLDNNGCFDFISQLLKTRSGKRMLWTLAIVTLLISVNLDNLTTTLMMLVIMRKIIPNRRHRMIYGSAIVVAANCGGAMTVIGDPTGLMLWNNGLVSATNYSMSLIVPCLVAWVVPTWWLGRSLPGRVETEWITMPYRGDDTRLNVWQRLLMLFVGIGGLWFIPTFHTITKLSPFIGALCVLGVLWIVNEVFNRKLMNMDAMVHRRMPRALFYGNHQLILFVMGIILALGVVKETGILTDVWHFLDGVAPGDWAFGVCAGVISSFLDNFATVASFTSLNPSTEMNADYWKLIAYGSAVGSNVLAIGSAAGITLMKTERIHLGWYFKNVGGMAAIGAALGFVVLALMIYA